MLNLVLQRFRTTDVTFGQIVLPSGQVIYTLERPWHDNEPDISCIPTGTYLCVGHDSPRHPQTWQLINVPNRTEVLIHTGNFEKDTLGCILIGLKHDFDNSDILQSDLALQLFRKEVGVGVSFSLTILASA